MEENVSENNSDVKNKFDLTDKRKWIAGSIGVLLLGVFIGYSIGGSSKNNNAKTAFVYVTPTPDTRLLSDPSDILKSKVFGEWYGGLEAKVISKTDKSFVVEANGQRLEIFMQDSITRLADETNPAKPVIITLAQLPVGSTVRGSVTISRGTLTGNMNQHVIANGISIIKK